MPGSPQSAAAVALVAWLTVHGGCSTDTTLPSTEEQSRAELPADDFARQRERMVREQLRGRDITDERVLAAMLRVPRHRFVPREILSSAYDDNALPLMLGQTISQPYIVAFMTQALRLKGGEKVLEIGTGSGYQAAVLAEVVQQVYTVEIVPELTEYARSVLNSLGYGNVSFHTGDGYEGWKEHAPFDAVIVTAAPEFVPPPLVEQLKPGGRMIIPVGRYEQELVLIEKTTSGISRRSTIPVRFVPMTGKARNPNRNQ